MTSNDGTFVFEGLKAGQYKALVKSTDADGKTVLAGSGSIGLLPGESREIAIELSKIEERKDMRLLVLGLAGYPEASWDLLLVDERTGETVLERYGIRDEEIFLEKVPYGEYELYIIAREGEDILFEHRSTFPVDFDSSPALEVAEEGFPPSIVLDTQCSEPILAKIDAKGKDGGEKAELSVVFSCLPDGIESSDVEIRWYADGRYVCSGPSFDYRIPTGITRIDAVFSCFLPGSVGSASLAIARTS